MNIKKLILLTIFFLPAYLVKIPLGAGASLNVLDLLILAIFSWWIFREKQDVLIYLKDLFSRHRAIVISLAFFVFGFFLTTFVAKDMLSHLGALKSWVVLPIFLALIVRFYFSDDKEKQRPLIIYFFSAVFVSFVSMCLFFFGRVTYDFRLQGIFNSPNYLAMYLAPAFILGFFYLIEHTNLKKENLKKGGILVLFLLLLAVSIFLTKSYASWAAIFIVFMIGSFIAFKNKFKVSIVALFFLILCFSQLFSGKAHDLLDNNRSSLNSRIMVWKSAEKITSNNYILGIGLANFQQEYLDYQIYFDPYLEWAIPHPHNILLDFWLSGGIISLLSFISLLFLIIKIFLKSKNKKALMGAFLCLIYFVFHGMIDSSILKNDLSVIFWMYYFYML